MSTESKSLNEARLDDEGLIVTADYLDESVQPWGGASCFRYIVRVSSSVAGDWQTFAYGSQHDYANGDHSHAEEMLYMVLLELLDAYWDGDEFFTLAIGEPDDVKIERVRGILEVIDYAEKIGPQLEGLLGEQIRAYEDGEARAEA